MVEPIYVPVLPTTSSACSAFRDLDPWIGRRIAPLWTVVPRVGPQRVRGVCPPDDPETSEKALQEWLTKRVDGVVRAMGGRGGWLDATHVERVERGAATSLWRVATRSGLRLVTGPERDPRHQRHIADLALAGQRGLGIRVLLDQAPDEARAAELDDMVRRLCLVGSQTDLLLDLGPVTDPQEAQKTALTALDLLGTLFPWRRVVLTSGAFPLTWGGRDAWPVRLTPRLDWSLHQAVAAARPLYPRRVVYGDYSVEHALRANTADTGRSSRVLVRYTTPDDFATAWAPLDGVARAERARRGRATVRSVVDAAFFRGGGDHGDSEAERWMYRCAHGEGPQGSGNAHGRVWAGHVQHLTFVVNQLTGRR
ncbi:hypothetical protein AQ490_21450 [Wenjunlia vitaminophila]|uniref:Beta protein n=1 Tax=Wenjunlia vitaminophila TaxID=76728 RepID=A0A0T6LT01_WENVI|nr:hypothetical protein [Wenjunlia vitaminophila]KRV49174.1 hypothetical protein AQ490_21450 [Wenjunlia vitaminophila]